MPQKQSKFTFFYEHVSGTQVYDYNALVDGVKPFDTDAGARQAALDGIVDHSENVYGEFEAGDWMIYIVELKSVTMYKTQKENIQLTAPKKLV